MRCGWCETSLEGRRGDTLYCSKRCRQAAWRFGRECPSRAPAGQSRRWGFADPPYPGLAHYYRGHPDYAGEVDHAELIERLCAGFDGWALCTSSDALRKVWAMCPDGTKLAPWARGRQGGKSLRPGKAWEAVLYFGERLILSSTRADALVFHPQPRLTDPRRVIGAKPAAFAYWVFDLLGARPGDELVDLYPGSGGIARAWQLYEASALEQATGASA